MAVAREITNRLFEAARAQWPGIELAPEAFARRFDALLADVEDPDSAALERATADLYLTFACLEQIPNAFVELERKVLFKVPGWVRRIVLSTARANEVRQEVAKRLLTAEGSNAPRLALYAGKGSLEGWVRVAAVRVAHNIRDAQHSVNGVPLTEIPTTREADPELVAVRKVYAKEFAGALRTTLDTLSRDERNVLRLHYLDGLSIDEVGAAYRVSRATAARMLLRAREAVASKMHELLASEIGAAAPEPASVLALIRDELEESLAERLTD